jgi:LDH2 family malate/lactate/ureidoglycolate dehydrogenase
MNSAPPSHGDAAPRHAPVDALDRFSRAVLSAAGADAATTDAATRAMMHGSRLGVDSHGIRLLGHYATVLTTGRVNPRPNMRITSKFAAIAALDGDHGHGALSTYKAMEHAVGLAGTLGLGAVAIRNSSHFGPAGAYALAAAEAGCIGMTICNTDSLVRLHDGAAGFHGTNPIACAVPTGGAQAWLLDMATSAVPFNRVLLNRSLGRMLPPGVASAPDGTDTEDPQQATMLAPLGGAFGYKGAGLAGFVEILSAVLTGMSSSLDMLSMVGGDLTTPRRMGAFVLAIRPDAVIDAASFEGGMQRYLDTLLASPTRAGGTVLAPGDREWAEAARREVQGVPIDPKTEQAFHELSAQYGIALPFAEPGAP